MSLVVNTNISSLVAQRNLEKNTSALQTNFERLSSGYRINSASDDAAGLSISEGLETQIRGNDQALDNIQDGINMLQTAEGSLEVINDNLQRIRELCVQGANDTYGTTEKAAMLDEIQERISDITRISQASSFNSIQLLDGSTSSMILQIGANSGSTNTIDIKAALPNSQATALGITMNITAGDWDHDAIQSYLDTIDTALDTLMSQRSTLGAYQNRLETADTNLEVMNENLQSSQSRIRDVDIAEETADMTKNQILQQAATSVLTQANQLPSLALSLLS